MTYNYSATQNNGRIVSSSDAVTGESVSYTYDALNRLIAAATTNPTGPTWNESYTFDGFGNMTSKVSSNGTPASPGGPEHQPGSRDQRLRLRRQRQLAGRVHAADDPEHLERGEPVDRDGAAGRQRESEHVHLRSLGQARAAVLGG